MRWSSLAFWCLRVTAGTKMTISSTINFQEYFYRDPARILHGFLHHGYFWFSAPAIQCQNYSKPVPRGFLLLCKYYNFWTELSVPYFGYFPSFKPLLISIASRIFDVVAVFYWYWTVSLTKVWMLTDYSITMKWWMTLASLKTLISFS